jgi:hypothetical protein
MLAALAPAGIMLIFVVLSALLVALLLLLARLLAGFLLILLAGPCWPWLRFWSLFMQFPLEVGLPSEDSTQARPYRSDRSRRVAYSEKNGRQSHRAFHRLRTVSSI